MVTKTTPRQSALEIGRDPMRLPDAPAHTVWPNGSGVFSASVAGRPGVELGRVIREGAGWRAWRRDGDAYVDVGIWSSQVAGILILPENAPPAVAAPVTGKKAAKTPSSAKAKLVIPR